MKRWRSVKMMTLALVALFLPAFAMPALCGVSNTAAFHASHRATPGMMCCPRDFQPAAFQPAAFQPVSKCCCKPSSGAPQPASRKANLPTLNAQKLSAQIEQGRFGSGPQYLQSILVFPAPVLQPLPQTIERRFQTASSLFSLDKSPPSPGRAPPLGSSH